MHPITSDVFPNVDQSSDKEGIRCGKPQFPAPLCKFTRKPAVPQQFIGRRSTPNLLEGLYYHSVFLIGKGVWIPILSQIRLCECLDPASDGFLDSKVSEPS